MSGGTPVSGGFMRQRLSQGYASSGDDLEDDACSRFQSPTPQIPKASTWIEVVENVLWIASAAFIIFFGDQHCNLIYLVWKDDRIRRKSEEKSEASTPSAAPVVALLGLLSYCLLCIALWPIWGFLTVLLLFSLFMACIVVSPYLMTGRLRPQMDMLRTD